MIPFLFLIAASIFTGCGESPEQILPYSIGGIDEVVVVMDEPYLEDSLFSLALKAHLEAVYPSLNRPEPIFDVIYCNLEVFGKSLVKHRNVIFIGDLEKPNDFTSYLTKLLGEANVEKIKAKDSPVMMTRNEVWSKGQHIFILAARSRTSLENGIDSGIENVISKIQNSELEKIRENTYRSGENKSLNAELLRDHGIDIKIPSKFEKIDASEGSFTFIRRSTIDLTYSIMIYDFPYTDSLQLALEAPIKVRDSLGFRYESSNIEGSYMEIDKMIPLDQKIIDFKGKYAIETRGLWRLVNDFMGGPFINYLIYDDANSRLVMLDAYVYSPDMSKRKLIRELESILNTYNPDSEN